MKKKKAIPEQPVEATARVPAEQIGGQDKTALYERLSVIAFSVLLLLSMTIQTGRMTIILSALAFLSAVLKWGRRAVPFCVPVLGFVIYGFIYGAAAAWSPFEQAAVLEFYRFMAAFSLALILLTRIGRKQVPALLWGVASVGTYISLLCVDEDFGGPIFLASNKIFQLFGASFDHLLASNETTRLIGLYNNANVNACITGVAALLCLYLLIHGDKLWKRAIAAVMTGLNALVFLLFVSRGAIIMFGLACVVWLIAVGRGQRLELFFRMLMCVVPAFALAFPAMGAMGTATCWPTVLAFLCGVLVFALDSLLVRPLTAFFGKHVKLALAMVGVVVVAAVAFCAVAFTKTGPYTFVVPDEYLARVVKLEPGDHVLTIDADDEVTVSIVIENRREWQAGQGRTLAEMMCTDDTLPFTVPDEKDVTLFVTLRGEPGSTVRTAAVDGEPVVMDYPLLPSSISSRLGEGFLTGNSFRNRLLFMSDAVKIWLTSPIWGRGISSTEELYTSVQPFYYESKYVHNHFLQVLTDTGILGLIPFCAFVFGSLWLLIRRLRKERDDMAAMLVAVWTLLIAHSCMEINFSIRAFQCYAYTLLLLPVICYGESLFNTDHAVARKRAKAAGVLLLAAMAIHSALFGTLLELHRISDKQTAEYTSTDPDEFLQNVKMNIRRDVFCRETLMHTFISTAVVYDADGKYVNDVYKYVAKMEKIHTYSSMGSLQERFYFPLQRWDDVFRCSREGLKHEASTDKAWNSEIRFCWSDILAAMGEENVDQFIAGVLSLADQLDEQNARMLVPVSINVANSGFIDACREVSASGLSSAEKFARLQEAAEVASVLDAALTEADNNGMAAQGGVMEDMT